MATYAFRAVNVAGVPQDGELEAASKAVVTEQLRQRGLIVLEVEERTSTPAIEDLIDRIRKVKARSLVVFSRQFATMISSGMSMLRALYTLEEQTEDRVLKETITKVREDVEAGSSLSAALAKHPRVFNDLYVAMVESGESGGLLEDSLDRVAYQLEKNDELRRQVRSAMAYPAMVMGFSLLVLFGMVAFLIPVFIKTFKEIGSGDLPALTKVTVGFSNFVTGRFYLIPVIILAAVFTFRWWKRTERGGDQWDRFKLRLPVKVGDVVQKIALARWSRTLSGLVSAGVPILRAIEITGQTAGNTQVEKAMVEVREEVRRGGTIAAPLREAPVFPSMVVNMVGAGEEAGALEHMLAKIADFYEAEVSATIKALTSIIEPLMIVFVGGMVGVIVISMYLPLFAIYNNIR
jgi:type IV pilus assembly protein PilC